MSFRPPSPQSKSIKPVIYKSSGKKLISHKRIVTTAKTEADIAADRGKYKYTDEQINFIGDSWSKFEVSEIAKMLNLNRSQVYHVARNVLGLPKRKDLKNLKISINNTENLE